MNIDYNLNFTPDAPENITIQPEDIEAPIISYTLINSEYILNSLPEIFNFSAQDSGVGIYKISATLDGNPITASQTILFEQLGSHEIKITAEDFVGNLATEIITYDVIYSFGGFLPPLKSDGSGFINLAVPCLSNFILPRQTASIFQPQRRNYLLLKYLTE